MKRAYTASIRLAAVVGFAYSVYAAAKYPIRMEEAQLWADLIRPPFQDALRAPDGWLGLWYGVVAERCIGILRLSPVALRLPALIAGGVCAWAVWRRGSLWVAMVYVGATAAGWFSTAQGQGIAATFCLTRPAPSGWRLGVAIAFSPVFALLLPIYWRIKDIERVVIPAVVAAGILLFFPAVHAGPVKSTDHRAEFEREANRRNAARGGGFQPIANPDK